MRNIETLLPTKTEFTQFRVQKYKKVWIYANKNEYFAKSVCFHIILRLYTLHFYTMRMRTIFKIFFPCTLYIYSVQKTNEEPKINQGTTKELRITKMCCLLRLPFFSPLLYLPLFYRPTTERRATERRINSPPIKSAVS